MIDAVSDPVSSFVRRRLQLQLTSASEGTPTQLPVHFVGLERWKVGDRLVQAVRRGLDPEEWLATERRRGSLPPGALGDASAEELTGAVEVLDEAVERLRIGGSDVETISVDVVLADGTRVVGSVPDSFVDGPRGPAAVGFGSMSL